MSSLGEHREDIGMTSFQQSAPSGAGSAEKRCFTPGHVLPRAAWTWCEGSQGYEGSTISAWSETTLLLNICSRSSQRIDEALLGSELQLDIFLCPILLLLHSCLHVGSITLKSLVPSPRKLFVFYWPVIVTNCHTLDGLKQYIFILLHFGRLDICRRTYWNKIKLSDWVAFLSIGTRGRPSSLAFLKLPTFFALWFSSSILKASNTVSPWWHLSVYITLSF